MEYTKLGNTDIEVSKLCVGCMSFGKAGTMHDWTLDDAAGAFSVKLADKDIQVSGRKICIASYCGRN